MSSWRPISGATCLSATPRSPKPLPTVCPWKTPLLPARSQSLKLRDSGRRGLPSGVPCPLLGLPVNTPQGSPAVRTGAVHSCHPTSAFLQVGPPGGAVLPTSLLPRCPAATTDATPHLPPSSHRHQSERAQTYRPGSRDSCPQLRACDGSGQATEASQDSQSCLSRLLSSHPHGGRSKERQPTLERGTTAVDLPCWPGTLRGITITTRLWAQLPLP